MSQFGSSIDEVPLDAGWEPARNQIGVVLGPRLISGDVFPGYQVRGPTALVDPSGLTPEQLVVLLL